MADADCPLCGGSMAVVCPGKECFVCAMPTAMEHILACTDPFGVHARRGETVETLPELPTPAEAAEVHDYLRQKWAADG